MKTIQKKWDRVNILKLYSEGNCYSWNSWLGNCRINRDVRNLEKVRYGLQYDMSELAKANLNNDKLSVYFIRLIKSIENTAREIYKDLYPSPLDNAPFAMSIVGTVDERKLKQAKKLRNDAFEKFMKDSAF